MDAKEQLNKVVSLFNKSFPDRHVKAVYGFKDNQLLIEAPKKNVNEDYENAFFVLSNKGITVFNPFDDFEGFCDAVDNHKVEV